MQNRRYSMANILELSSSYIKPSILSISSLLLYPPYPKDRGMLWFYVEAARRPQWC